MRNFIMVRPVINKRNGQINISLPKRKMPRFLKEDLAKRKSFGILFKTVRPDGRVG